MVHCDIEKFTNSKIGNAKTKDQINTELSELIGDEFDPAFTDWLFNQVEDISYQGDNHERHEYQDESMEEAHPESTNSTPTRRNLRGAHASSRSAAAPYPQPSRVLDQINRTLERPPTIKHSIPDLPNVPTGPRSQSSAGPIRRGRGGLGRPPVIPPIPPNFGAFMIANGVPPDILQQMMVDAANFPNQMFPAGNSGFPLATRISDMDGSSGIIVAGGDKNRCRHWPRCQLGARCKFHHPSQICPYFVPISSRTDFSDFPNCPNTAGTCPNIHVGEDIPESEINNVVAQQLTGGRPVNGHNKSAPKANGHVPRRENQPPKHHVVKPQEQLPLCKFGPGCTKPDCPFAHPTPAAGQDGLVLRGEMCPDGRKCLNREVSSISCMNITNCSVIWAIQVLQWKESHERK